MNWLKQKVLEWAARKAMKKIIVEGPMETKKWYQSKTVLSGIAVVVIGTYDLVRAHLAPQLPEIPAWIITILGSIGIYGRVTADKRVG